jgi:uncharacterized membrane protein YdbT with pleckstrin-like domain
MNQRKFLWSDKKRTLFGLPLSFTRYILTNEKLLIKTGFLNTKEEEIKLYRILDFTVRRTLLQRIFGVGEIELHTADSSTPVFVMQGVKNVETVKELMSQKVEEIRLNRKVGIREEFHNDIDDIQ